MSDNEQTEPVMDGATDATNHEKLQGLIEQVAALSEVSSHEHPRHGSDGPD